MNGIEVQDEVIAATKKAYDWAIENGIAKEQARKVLPEGLTKTRLYMNGTIRSVGYTILIYVVLMVHN